MASSSLLSSKFQSRIIPRSDSEQRSTKPPDFSSSQQHANGGLSMGIALQPRFGILTGISRSNTQRSEIQTLSISDGATGPESLAFDPDGSGPYTGISDGRILKWEGEEIGWLDHAFTTPSHLVKECKGSRNPNNEDICGRPLGLQFNKNSGKLYIADAYFGLMDLELGEKFAVPVITHAQGHKLQFTNALDIDQETGVVYFTESSMHFQRREFMKAIITGDRSGRLIRYDPRNGDVRALLTNLSFPNGIMLSSDRSFIIFAETTTCWILKYRLLSNNTDYEVLVELPGFPDNIKPSPRGGFWVALHSRRRRLLRKFLSLPTWLRGFFIYLPFDLHRVQSLLSKWTGEAIALRISEDGEILDVLENFGGDLVKYISEVEERNGSLWIGSVSVPVVGVYKI